MREPILKAVAMPPRVFWAPMYPAVVNFSIQMGIMCVCTTTFNLNPIYFIGTIAVSHGLIAAYSVREPHLSKMVLPLDQMSTSSLINEVHEQSKPQSIHEIQQLFQ